MMPIKSTRIRFCLKTEIFSFDFAYCPHVCGENDHRKRIFSKTLSREEIIENACFLFTCGWTKTKVFEFDDVIHRIYIVYYQHYAWALSGMLSISIVLVFLSGRGKTIRIHLVQTRILGKTEGKNKKISGYVWKGPESLNSVTLCTAASPLKQTE